MAYIIELKNPFDPTDIEKHLVLPGPTIREWLNLRHPGFSEFERPTVCVRNGQALLREQWNTAIEEDDVIVFTPLPGYMWIAIAMVIMVAAMAVLYTQIPSPQVPGEAPASDPVYTLKGQQNQIRLGEPVEVCYGRNRVYPSLGSRPYFQYVDNEQFQFTLLVIGQGSYEVHSIQIGDTDINAYQEVEYEVIPPGESPSLFPSNVVTSPEVGGQTIFAPNDEESVGDGWIGPFPVNPSGTTITDLEIDIIFPNGLYYLNNKGDMDPVFIDLEIEWRPIDDAGLPVGAGAWSLGAEETIEGITTTAQRRTFRYPVSPARYEARIRRTDQRNQSYRAGHVAVWDGLRGFIIEEDAHTFGDKTLLAVRIRATNNLNERTQLAFNVVCTRKLPRYEDGEMSTELYATRSIVWAYVDALRSRYGGRMPDKFFAWDELLALDDLYETRGDYFDWIFRDAITVWEAARTIAKTGRAVPLLVGSLVTMKRDAPMEIPVSMFTPDNIIGGSFQWDIKLWDLDENDSLRIEYTEPATGYKQETVVCVLPEGTADNPRDVRFPGISERAQAFREGMYLLAAQTMIRENVTFDTGLEGHIPTFGDLIAVSHDLPRWGQWGYILQAEPEDEQPGVFRLALSEPLRQEAEEPDAEYVMMLRGRYAQTLGPFPVAFTETASEVILDLGEGFDFLTGGGTEPMVFIFGESGYVTKYCKITRIEPQGGETIRITAINDEPVIHSFDELPVPALAQAAMPPLPPDLPVIRDVYLHLVDPVMRIIQISWSAAFGSRYYIVQSSLDGEAWTERATTTRTSIQLQASGKGELHVRVAAVNTGQGPWKTVTQTFRMLAGVNILQEMEDSGHLEIGWDAVSGVTQYRVRVYDLEEIEPALLRSEMITDTNYSYSFLDALADGGLTRSIRVDVETAPGGIPDEDPVRTSFTNEPLTLPPDVDQEGPAIPDGDDLIYPLTVTLPDKGDVYRVRIWAEETEEYDLGTTPPKIDVSAENNVPGPDNFPAIFPLSLPDGHPVIYVTVAVTDCWGDEITTNKFTFPLNYT